MKTFKSSIRNMGFSMILFGQNLYFYFSSVIFSKCLDGIKGKAPSMTQSNKIYKYKHLWMPKLICLLQYYLCYSTNMYVHDEYYDDSDKLYDMIDKYFHQTNMNPSPNIHTCICACRRRHMKWETIIVTMEFSYISTMHHVHLEKTQLRINE